MYGKMSTSYKLSPLTENKFDKSGHFERFSPPCSQDTK